MIRMMFGCDSAAERMAEKPSDTKRQTTDKAARREPQRVNERGKHEIRRERCFIVSESFEIGRT